jgi:hypothetical protein
MGEAKCPACRKRFPVDSETMECARCGADLSLLIKLRRHAARLAADALADPTLDSGDRMGRLKKAQFVCASPEVQLLMSSLESSS